MKNDFSNRPWFNSVFLISALSVLSTMSCSKAELEHPLNPSSDKYIGDEYAIDSDGDGRADIYDLYNEDCGQDLDCIINHAQIDSLIIPLSSSSVTSPSSSLANSSDSNPSSSALNSSSSIDISLPTFTVKLINGVFKGTSLSLGDYPANTKLELVANTVGGLDNCFDGWTASEGIISSPSATGISYRLPITPVSDTITISAQTSACPGQFVDERDGQKYSYTKVGVEIWTSTNMNYSLNGALCYGDTEANCDLYGRLYNYSDALLACPSGWSLPKKSDYDKFIISNLIPAAGYGVVNGLTPSFEEKENRGRYWTSESGAATVDAGVLRNFCNNAPEGCATGYAYNNGGAEGWEYYAAEEKKSNLFSVRCILD